MPFNAIIPEMGQLSNPEIRHKTYVNCHKAHGKKLFVIIKYVVGLPVIGEEALEI